MNHVIWMLVVVSVMAVQGEPNLGTDTPVRQVDERLEVMFSHEQASKRLGQIQDALGGYRDLVDIICQKSNLLADYRIHHVSSDIPEETKIVINIQGKDLTSCNSVGWESQNIGFWNLLKGMKGYIEFQEYQNLKLRLEVAQLKGSPSSEVNQLVEKAKETRTRLVKTYIEGMWAD